MTEQRPTTLTGRPTALAVMAGAFGSLDTALNIAFPALTADFDLEVGGLQWVVTCFVLSYGVSLMAAGRLGDRLGHSTVMAFGAATAALGLAICATAPVFLVLLVGRVVQGIGTALVMASAPALITVAAGESARGRAVGLFQTSAAVGLTIGPILGGPLVDLAGWRAVFWFRIPLAVVMLIMAIPLIRATGGLRPRRSREAVVEPAGWPRLLRSGDFVAANTLSVVANGAMFATWLLVPALLIDELGVGVLTAGLVLAVSPAATALMAARAGRLADRGHASRLVGGGLLLLAAGMAFLSRADAGWNGLPVALGLATVGLGLGAFSVPNMAIVMAALPTGQQGVAAGLALTTRTVGIVVGVTASGRLFDGARDEQGFIGAFSMVFVIMAGILVLAGSLEIARRVVSGP